MGVVYATPTDLTNLAAPAGALQGPLAPTEDQILAALQASSDFASGKIGAHPYVLPLTNWGSDLRQAVCQHAAWTLFSGTRGVMPSSESRADDRLAENYRQALKWFDEVRSGEQDITDVVDSANGGVEPAPVARSARPQGWGGRYRGGV